MDALPEVIHAAMGAAGAGSAGRSVLAVLLLHMLQVRRRLRCSMLRHVGLVQVVLVVLLSL